VGVFDVLARAVFLRADLVGEKIPASHAPAVCPFRTVASRCCSAPARALSVDDENPRLTACAAWDCLPALRTHIASIVRALLLSSIFTDDLVGFPSSSLVSSRAE
jgi:hypothetical protein